MFRILLFLLSVISLYPAVSFSIALEDAIRVAVDNSAKVQASLYSFKGNKKYLEAVALSGFFPSVTYSYQSAFTNTMPEYKSSGVVHYGGATNEGMTVSMVQNIFDGGANIATFKKSKHLLESEEIKKLSTERSVQIDAVRAYMNAITALEVYKLSQHTEKVLREHLVVAKKRFSLGEITKTDVAQAQSRLSSAASNTIKAGGDLKAANAFYAHIIGEDPKDLIHPEKLPDVPSSFEHALDSAQRNNLSLKAAFHGYKAAKEDTHVALSGALPSVSLAASIGYGTYSQPRDFASLTFGISMPIFDRGLNIAKVEQSYLLEKSSLYNYNEKWKEVTELVLAGWENVVTTEAIVRASKEAVKAADVALKGVQQESELNLRPILDVLDSESELFQAKAALINAQGNYVIGVYNLLYLIGELNVT